MRVVIARMQHETNTFSPVPTPLAAFGTGNGAGPYYGRDAERAMTGARVAMGAMLDAARARGCAIVTPLAAMAYPSAPVQAAAYTRMCDAICDAVAAGCDAILLDLHGAMVAENSDDGEGDLLERIRALAPDTPLAVALDLHANVSPKMVAHADILVGYKTYPHIDMYETGEHAARLLFDMVDGRSRPVLGYAHARVLAQTLEMNTNRAAMKAALDGARWREQDAGILACSVFGGFPQADTAAAGMSVVVVADARRRGGAALAQRTADWGADFLWSRRAAFIFHQEPLADSIVRARRAAARANGRPVILMDHGDNVMSGGTCDTIDVLGAALDAGFDGIVVGPTCDPQAVAQMAAAGIGAEVSLMLGNRTPMPGIGLDAPRPLALTGRVRMLSDGTYTVRGPIFTGDTMYMGRTAVLDTGRAQIVVTSQPHEPLDLGCFTSVGIDPGAARFLVLKSRMYFRPVFEPLAAAVVPCASAGVTSSDNAIFRFSRVRRPIYPLDPFAARARRP
ncbi:MAG: M81 family metallopeptidase [Burkholderiales bacterium]|nr:M81 family metallopeptidase [Burkholderiales bacterium]